MVRAGEAGPRLNASLGHPIQPLRSCSDSHHGCYYLGLLFTEHLLYARLYAKSFPSQHHLAVGIFTTTPGAVSPLRKQALDLAPRGTVRRWQSPGAESEFLVCSFQCVEDQQKAMQPPLCQLLHSFLPSSSLHPSSCPPKSHPLLLVLDVKNDLKSIY